jgi:soluble lytic murein transglycosylase-like protein
LNSVSATEHSAEHRGEHWSGHHHYSHAARLTAHHVVPMEAGTGAVGFGQMARPDGVSGMAAAQASAAGVPASLVERVIRRESGGNPRAVHAGNYGLMQIKLGTARAMGYTGSAAGLLDPQTNMTYAVRYLAGAYRAAGGNESRAVALYASGYYTQAKARGFSPYASAAPSTTAAGFGFFTPTAFDTAGASSGSTPVYRVRHIRRHAV